MKSFIKFMLSLVVGNIIFGKVNIGDVYLATSKVNNPFADKIYYRKIMDIKDGYILYAAYSEYDKAFTHKNSDTIRDFMTFNEKVKNLEPWMVA